MESSVKTENSRECPNPNCTAKVQMIAGAVESHRIHGRRAHACATDLCPASGMTTRQLWLDARDARAQVLRY